MRCREVTWPFLSYTVTDSAGTRKALRQQAHAQQQQTTVTEPKFSPFRRTEVNSAGLPR